MYNYLQYSGCHFTYNFSVTLKSQKVYLLKSKPKNNGAVLFEISLRVR